MPSSTPAQDAGLTLDGGETVCEKTLTLTAAAENIRTAGLARRGVAVVLDSLLVLVAIAMPLSAASGRVTTNPELPDGEQVTGISIALSGRQWGFVLLVGLVYAVAAEAVLGATVGKLLLGLRVVRFDGTPIGWTRAAVRNFLRVVDGFPFVVPYLLGWAVALGDARQRQRLGDRVARSVVVRVPRHASTS